jgi:murein DD-endopeptidase MepM/ murein hydrolase activator NlpD
MIVMFKKNIIISSCLFICVSCAIPPVQQPPLTPAPVTRDELKPSPSPNNQQQPPSKIQSPTLPVVPEKPPVQSQLPIKPAPSISPPSIEQPELEQPEQPTVVETYPTPSQPIQPTSPPLLIAQLPKTLQSLSQTVAVPGGIAWISLYTPTETPPKLLYQDKPVVVLRDQNKWVALVGVPLNAKTGLHSVIDQQTQQRYTFTVKAKKYDVQRIQLKNKRHVTPNKQDLERIIRESKVIKAALKSPWRATATSPLPLKQPVSGRFSSPFGLRRYFNGKRRNPHTGLDIAAPLGTPIKAPAAGQVVNTGDYFFTGNTIIIDHGQGVVTLYGHLDQISVSTGDTVETGDIIGHVGKTGRATGPHLHWGVSMNQTMVDPKLIMQ